MNSPLKPELLFIRNLVLYIYSVCNRIISVQRYYTHSSINTMCVRLTGSVATTILCVCVQIWHDG